MGRPFATNSDFDNSPIAKVILVDSTGASATTSDGSGAQIVNQSALNATTDEVTSRIRQGNPVLLTTTASILAGPGQMTGFYVNSTTAGTLIIYNSPTSALNAVSGTITPTVGWNNFPSDLSLGGWVVIGGTINVTFFVIPD
jgi:hypothetical protein